MQIPLVVVLISYPLTAHLSIYFGHVEVAAYYLACLLTLPFITYPIHKNRRTLLIGLLFLPLVIVLLWSESAANVVLFQPSVLYFALAMLFTRTLAADSEPLISRFIRAMDVTVPYAIDAYGRRTTLAWAVFFGVLTFISVGLAVYATVEIWSWFVNVASYILAMLMLVLNYVQGRRCFAEHEAISFLQFMRGLTRVNVRGIVGR